MEHLVSQLTELKLKMLHVDDDESASKPTSARDPEHQAIQLLDHTILLAEHASLQATYKVIERKHMDLMKKFDMKQKNEESLQAEVEKLTWGYRSKQADFTSQQATLVDLQKEYTKLKADHHDLESQHRNLQSRVEDSKRSESFLWYTYPVRFHFIKDINMKTNVTNFIKGIDILMWLQVHCNDIEIVLLMQYKYPCMLLLLRVC